MLKLDVTNKIIGIDGEALKASPTDDAEVSLKSIMVNAVLGQYKGEEELSGEKKIERYLLATKIQECSGEFEFSSSDVVLIKSLVNKMYGPYIVGVVWSLLTEESKATEK